MSKMKVNTVNGEAEVRLDGYIVQDEDKWIYDWFEYPAVCPKDFNELLAELDGKPLTVKINSYGGSVWAGSVIYTSLKGYSGIVTIKIDGLAASAASVVAMAGSEGKIMMSPTAQMMIHNASTYASGDYRDMDKASEMLKSTNKTVANAYMLKTGMTQDELLALMDKETWLSAQDALDYKFVDEMMFAEAVPAPEVIDALKNNAMAIYNSFHMPSPKAIEKLKKHIQEPQQNNKLTPEQESAIALLEIENNRF